MSLKRESMHKFDNRSSNGWTLDTLAKHLVDKINDVEARTRERFDLSKMAVDSALAAAEKAISAAMFAAEKAVSKAEAAAEKRFDSVNEFRAAMKDQTADFADKDQVNFRLNAMEVKMEKLFGREEGISSVGVFVIGGASVLAVGISLVTLIFNLIK